MKIGCDSLGIWGLYQVKRVPGRRRDCARFSNGGFTFVEMLVAMVFVAIVIPVAVEGVLVANRSGVVAERKRIAAQIADTVLLENVATGEWLTGEREGEFDEWPGFKWALEDETWEEDLMVLLTVTVTYDVQGKEYEVRMSTLVEEEEEAA